MAIPNYYYSNSPNYYSNSPIGGDYSQQQGMYITPQFTPYEVLTAGGLIPSQLEDLIKQCGKSFYYLVSPYASDSGKWVAKGTKAQGEGATPEEAVKDLLTKLTQDN